MNELRLDLVAIRARIHAAVDNPNLEVQQCVELFPAFLAVIDEATTLRSDLSAAQKRIETMRIALEDIREWAPQDAVMKFDAGDELVIDRCCRALNPTPP